MSTWKQISRKYPTYLTHKKLKQPKIRLSALNEIERYLLEQYPSIMNGFTNFAHVEMVDLKGNYEAWKTTRISGAEAHVFNDFYKLYAVTVE